MLESFLGTFEEYAREVLGAHERKRLDSLRVQLRRQEPEITDIVVSILGDGVFTLGSLDTVRNVTYRNLLPTALMGGNNEVPFNFRDFSPAVTGLLNKALGTLKAGLPQPKETTPVLLVIKDPELRNRCSDLLGATDAYDRVLREATTVLEDRIRGRVSQSEMLSRSTPNATERDIEDLVNRLFSPTKPLLVISRVQRERFAFQRILLGTLSYLRNPYHHRLDPDTERSWAWSAVGFVDRLLADIDSCEVTSTVV